MNPATSAATAVPTLGTHAPATLPATASASTSVLLPRALPLRVEPLPGEALDSWLNTYARRLDITMTSLLNALGLQDSRGVVLDLTIALNPPQARRAAHAAGLDQTRLHEMTLASYAPGVVHLRADRRALATSTPWLRPRGSRYCPDCLQDNAGRWPLAWQLSWVFACTRHQALLLDLCPACRQVPTPGRTTRGPIPGPCRCTRLTRTDDHDRTGDALAATPCDGDLTAAGSFRLDLDDPRLTTQQHLNTYLADHNPQHEQHSHRPSPQSPTPPTLWSDLHALACWSAVNSTLQEFAAIDEATASAWRALTIRPWAHQQYLAAASAPLTAALLTWALPVITAAGPPDAHDPSRVAGPAAQSRSQILQDLTRIRRRAHRATSRTEDPIQGYRPPGMLTRHWQNLSTPLQRLLLQAADQDLPKADRLRAYTPTPAARLPGPHGKVSARRTRWIPQLLWPEWLVRLMPQAGYRNDVHRAALSAALLLPGLPSTMAPSNAAARIHAHLPHWAVTTMLRRYLQDGHTSVFAVLCDLAEGLDEHGSPINYHRRRRVITGTGLLTSTQWENLCETAGTHPGLGRRLIDARRYLLAVLTGADLTDPHHRLAYTSQGDRKLHYTFQEQLPSPLRVLMLQHAADHLTKLGLNEPLTWSPPTDWITSVALDALPGRDPADIDLDVLARLAAEQVPVSTAAEQLGVSTDHIRLALERLARPSPQHQLWATRRRASRLLTGAFFEREYLTARKTLRQLQKETGFNRKLLGEYANAAGIELRTPAPPLAEIDPDWLKEQYLTKGRSTKDIAAELGIAGMTINRAARRYGIAPRPQGVASRTELITRLPSTAPADLRAAVEGHLHAWSRLERFAEAMTYPTVRHASTGMAIAQHTLVVQFKRLEHDIGTVLYHRATQKQPQQPTPRGQALLQTLARPEIKALRPPQARPAARGSAGAHSLTRRELARSQRPARLPPGLPSDLRRTVEGKRYGWLRLQRFADAMTYPTLTEASSAMGIHVTALIEVLHRLENDIGETLFHRARSDGQIQRPTPRGKSLLRTLARPDIRDLLTSRNRTPSRPAETATAATRNIKQYPLDLRRAVHGQRSGWIRLERFATAMTYPTLTQAATTIGINRSTLIEQLDRLERDVGEPLFERATANGQHHRPTRCGTALLQILAQPDIQDIRTSQGRLPMAASEQAEPDR